MRPLELLLAGAAVLTTALWVVGSLYVLGIERRRAHTRALASEAIAELSSADIRRLPLDTRVAHVRPILDRASRELVMHAAAADDTSASVFEALNTYLVQRWGYDALERDATAHRTAREKWRRMTALSVLFRSGHQRSLELLARAVDEADRDVASVAFSLLGRSNSPEAVRILLRALRRQQHPASRVAVHLDRSPQHLAEQLRGMLADTDPSVRLWAATLLGRYPDAPGLEDELAALANDPDARVRKAAAQSLGQIGGELAASIATRLLVDPEPFVRATAARTIGKLDRIDLAEDVVLLLGDQSWWVRFAAKECLESLGSEVWPVLARSLEHPDRFVRNGAAEVFQNLGVLDSFIVMEAASDNPASTKIDMLRRVVLAGGLRLTDSLIERTGAIMGARVRQLLNTIGLQQVGAA